jgi:threonine dehydratase
MSSVWCWSATPPSGTAQEVLWASVRIVAEPGAAAPLAALFTGGYVPALDERVGVIISGGNTTAVDFGSR